MNYTIMRIVRTRLHDQTTLGSHEVKKEVGCGGGTCTQGHPKKRLLKGYESRPARNGYQASMTWEWRRLGEMGAAFGI